MFNSIRFPKNLSSIKNNVAFKEYCLNPLGMKHTIPNHFEKPRKQVEYLNQ